MAYRKPIKMKVKPGKTADSTHVLVIRFSSEHGFDVFCAQMHGLATAHPTNMYLQELSNILDAADKEAN